MKYLAMVLLVFGSVFANGCASSDWLRFEKVDRSERPLLASKIRLEKEASVREIRDKLDQELGLQIVFSEGTEQLLDHKIEPSPTARTMDVFLRDAFAPHEHLSFVESGNKLFIYSWEESPVTRHECGGHGARIWSASN